MTFDKQQFTLCSSFSSVEAWCTYHNAGMTSLSLVTALIFYTEPSPYQQRIIGKTTSFVALRWWVQIFVLALNWTVYTLTYKIFNYTI